MTLWTSPSILPPEIEVLMRRWNLPTNRVDDVKQLLAASDEGGTACVLPSTSAIKSEDWGNACQVIAEGKEAGREFEFDQDSVVIGRTAECDVILYEAGVSRKHARILLEGASLFIEDLGSSNGTWFNKQRIKRRKIEDGDEYFVCSERLRCTLR